MIQKSGNKKIIWSVFASKLLKDIYYYHEVNASITIAQNILSDIFNSTKQLEFFPESGQIEENLRKLIEGHRYLISGNYKIIYKLIDSKILITDIFDSRQDPGKMKR